MADDVAPAAGETDLHATALERFKFAAQAESKQRTREITAQRFVDFDEQWPEAIVNSRKGSTDAPPGAPQVPERPCLTINKLRQPVDQVCNQARQARLALSFAPKGNGASKETAEAFEDIVRGIQANSRAHLARQWAFERATKVGRGFYRILTDYANDGDFDQDIIYKRILNQATVYLDPTAQEPDWSDGEWAFITEDLPLERYKRLYPDSELASSDEELTGIGDDMSQGWITATDNGKVVRVAEYWYIEHQRVKVSLFRMPDGSEHVFPDVEAPEGAQLVRDRDQRSQSRYIDRPTVKWCKLNGVEILEKSDWPGRYIPIVPVIGQETNVNGDRRWFGIVEPAMDAQRSYNYMRSAQAESVGLAPRAPFVAYVETIEGYEAWWTQANVRNFPYLPIKAARAPDGSALPPPQRNVVEPAIQAITLAAHEADADIKATTGIHDPSLGNLSPQERSGKAILALQKQSEQGTSGYIDNLAQMSIIYEGKILRDLIPKVYNRPGRIVAAMGEDDQARQIMLGQPFVMEQGTPRPAQKGEKGARMIDLSTGEYAVAVTVGKSYTTRREEGVAQMGDLAQAVPNMVPMFADLWVGNMDFPGAKQIADRLEKAVPANLKDNGDGGPDVATLQAQLQQVMQMLELQGKELEARTRAMETDQVKAEADFKKQALQEQAETQRTQLELAAKVQIAEITANTQFGVAELKAGLDSFKLRLAHIESLMGHEAEARQLESEQAHDAQQMERDRQAAAAEGERGRQHESGEAAQSRAFEADENERARQAEADRAMLGDDK